MRAMAVRAVPMIAALAALAACGTGPATPPTFVIGYAGLDGRVRTAQSLNGTTWVLPATAPAPTSTSGAAVAHDGTLTWMVLWNAGGQMSFVTGAGGLAPPPGTAGIVWETAANPVPRTSQVTRNPALAYGNGAWVAAFRGGDGNLRVIPSILAQSPTVTGEVDTMIASADASPALAFGSGRFVLVFVRPVPPAARTELAAVTSTDGRSWSAPVTLLATTVAGNTTALPVGAAVTYSAAESAFYVVGRRSRQGPNLTDSGLFVLRSADGMTWTAPVAPGTGPGVDPLTAGIPGAAYTPCTLIVAHTEGGAGANVGTRTLTGSPCPNPTSFAVGPFVPVAGLPTAAPDRVMAVSFGRGP